MRIAFWALVLSLLLVTVAHATAYCGLNDGQVYYGSGQTTLTSVTRSTVSGKQYVVHASTRFPETSGPLRVQLVCGGVLRHDSQVMVNGLARDMQPEAYSFIRPLSFGSAGNVTCTLTVQAVGGGYYGTAARSSVCFVD